MLSIITATSVTGIESALQVSMAHERTSSSIE